MAVGLTDLSGRLLAEREEPAADIARGPDKTLDLVDTLFTQMLSGHLGPDDHLWGIGIGVPGPVEFTRGRPVAPPIMPGWDGYPVRDRYADRYGVPAWVDNEVNTMALGELRSGLAKGGT